MISLPGNRGEGRLKSAQGRQQKAIAAEVGKNWISLGDAHLPYRLLLLGKVMDRATANQIRAAGDISLAEWRVLAHAHMLGPCRASEIASAAFVDRSEVSRAIFSLEERGILMRVPDPKSRRGNLVSLTADGQALHAELRESRRRCFEQWMSNLDADERQTIEHGLLKILRNVMAEETDSSSRDPSGLSGD